MKKILVALLSLGFVICYFTEIYCQKPIIDQKAYSFGKTKLRAKDKIEIVFDSAFSTEEIKKLKSENKQFVYYQIRLKHKNYWTTIDSAEITNDKKIIGFDANTKHLDGKEIETRCFIKNETILSKVKSIKRK